MKLHVRTAAARLPPDFELLWLLPDERPLAWIRDGSGLVGWGTAWQIATNGTRRFADAEAAWGSILATAEFDELSADGAGLVGFGSFAFDPASPTPSHLVVPQVVVRAVGDRHLVTTISASDASRDPLTELDRAIREASRPRPLPPPAADLQEVPGALAPACWQDAVDQALSRISKGKLEKVVLARDIGVRATNQIDPRVVLGRLAIGYRQTWVYCVAGLVGATPELLVGVRDGQVASRVLAGTSASDPLAMDRLATSAKDLAEHKHAVSSVEQVLRKYCDPLRIPGAPRVLQLPNVAHLATDLTGWLLPAAPPSSLALAAALHPSAAICGTPTETALRAIRDLEKFDRGRYSGPVGWLNSRGEGEWGIALRAIELLSVCDNRSVGFAASESGRIISAAPEVEALVARIYAGCGVVAGSVPAEELAESEAKLAAARLGLGMKHE